MFEEPVSLLNGTFKGIFSILPNTEIFRLFSQNGA